MDQSQRIHNITHTHTHSWANWQLAHTHMCLTTHHLTKCHIHTIDTYHTTHQTPHQHRDTQTHVSRF